MSFSPSAQLPACLKAGDTKERVGLVLADGSVIELENVALNPEREFEASPADMVKHDGNTIATWHTHTSGPPRLSVNDVDGFLMWPHLQHWIVTPEGITGFKVENGAVFNL